MSTGRLKSNILLVNPWIYDFSAYDFWQKPLGLLYIGAILNKLGYTTCMLDCLDRFNPEWNAGGVAKTLATKNDGSGKYIRHEIAKPVPLANVPRKYCRYGAPPEKVALWLERQLPPDIILMTSFMTYWYPAVRDMACLLRAHFPETPLLLGGIYASLCPDHARETIQPDYLLIGEGEIQAVRLISDLCAGPGAGLEYKNLDELPYPWYDGYPALGSVALLTSRGCPYQCSYCASGLLAPKHKRRSAEAVCQEILHWHNSRNVRNFAFFDDALLYQSERYAKPLFGMLAAAEADLALHTPNGLHPRWIDSELAELMYTAGFNTLRLSYESSSIRHQQGKVSYAELAAALHALQAAGFKAGQIGVYLLAGLPEQTMEEVRSSVKQVHELGARVNLASYSPIPGTREYKLSLERCLWNEQDDLLLANNSLYPFWRKHYQLQELEELHLWIKQLNQSLLPIDEE